MASTATASTPAVETTPKTAEERLALALGKFKAADGPTVSPYDAKRKELQATIRTRFAQFSKDLAVELGESFADVTDVDAAAKTAASLNRAQTSALKAVRSISDDTLKGRESAVVEGDTAE